MTEMNTFFESQASARERAQEMNEAMAAEMLPFQFTAQPVETFDGTVWVVALVR